jgi:hypothetical protein
MRLLTLLTSLGLASQAFASPFSCSPKDPNDMTLEETDDAVHAYFSKLEPATKKTALHDTTGPEAGADVRRNPPLSRPYPID